MRVMLVDDEKVMLVILKRLLSHIEGVLITGSFLKGAEALDWVRSEAVDVAFIDIQMNGEDGIGLAKQLLAIRRELKIVFVTSHKEYALDAFELGAVDYIVKPIIMERLEQTIHRIAGERRSFATSQDEPAYKLTVNALGGMAAHSRFGDVKWISGKSHGEITNPYISSNRSFPFQKNRWMHEIPDARLRQRMSRFLLSRFCSSPNQPSLSGNGS